MKNRAENSMVLEDGVQDGNAIRRRDFLYMTGMVVAVGLFIPNTLFDKGMTLAHIGSLPMRNRSQRKIGLHLGSGKINPYIIRLTAFQNFCNQQQRTA